MFVRRLIEEGCASISNHWRVINLAHWLVTCCWSNKRLFLISFHILRVWRWQWTHRVSSAVFLFSGTKIILLLWTWTRLWHFSSTNEIIKFIYFILFFVRSEVRKSEAHVAYQNVVYSPHNTAYSRAQQGPENLSKNTDKKRRIDEEGIFFTPINIIM